MSGTSRGLLTALALPVKPSLQPSDMASTQTTSALAAMLAEHAALPSAPVQHAGCVASTRTVTAPSDGFLCCPSIAAAAVDLLSPALLSSAVPAPTVLSAVSAYSVESNAALRKDTAWLCASSAGAAQDSRSAAAGTALQLQGLLVQAAKKTKRDVMEAGTQLVYDVEWQASHAWRAGEGKPSTPMHIYLLIRS